MQKKIDSLYEALVNTAIGFAINFTAQVAFFWAINFIPKVETNIPLWVQFIFAVFMTLVSVARNYKVRRFFNKRT